MEILFRLTHNSSIQSVNELVNPQYQNWDLDKLNANFAPVIVSEILNTPISRCNIQDTLIIWKLQLPRRVQVFLWRFFHEALATNATLQLHHLNVPQDCHFCSLSATSYKTWLITWLSDAHQKSKDSYPVQHLAPFILMAIWQSRNQLLFQGHKVQSMEVVFQAMQNFTLYA